MWNNQLVKWLTRSYEIKKALKANLTKVLESELSFGDLESRKNSKETDGKLFDLKKICKFAHIRAELAQHPLD